MVPPPFDEAFILTGPTGCGKTSLGIELAERMGAEIVSMDSMAVYRGLDIGTAKPKPEQRQRVPHHLLDVLEPWESASVAWWLKEAAHCVHVIRQHGKPVLIVGGTPLYLKALLRGLFAGPPADEAIRQRLAAEGELRGCQALHERLSQVDALTAARLHPHDVRRIIRALEVWELTGRPISSWQSQWHSPMPETPSRESRVLWLDLSRQELYAQIDRRVHDMMAAGFVDEVHALRRLPRPLSREAAQAVGYKEILDYLDGRCQLPEAVALIQQRSRNLAKRQLTWFRNLPECRPATRELTFAAWGLTIEE